MQQKRIRELTEELEAVKKELAIQIKLAEGAKKLVLHLNGDMPAEPPSEDEDEVVAEAGEATAASILRSSITDRRGSIRDEALLEVYDDEASDAASVLAVSDEISSLSQSRSQMLRNSSWQHPQSSPSSLSRNQMRKTPPRQRPRLAARKAALEGKQEGHHVAL